MTKTQTLCNRCLLMIRKEGLDGEEVLRLGSYNALLKSSLPKEYQTFNHNAEEESFESSHEVFRAALPRGFAWEVIAVYSGPPVITFKFRYRGYDLTKATFPPKKWSNFMALSSSRWMSR
ncbi:hypothetical protein vseg_021666 [Gypsophila vaccaria]